MGAVERLVGNMAPSRLVVHVSNAIIQLEAILIIVETDRLRLESPQLRNQTLDTILPHPGLIPNVEVGEGGHDVVSQRAWCLTLAVKRSVPMRWMVRPSGNDQRL